MEKDSGGLKSKELYPAVFSRHAGAYQRRLQEVMARGEARGRQMVIDYVEAKPGMRIIDLACGPGTLSAPLAARVAPGGEVVGIDLAEGMIDLARSAEIPNARFAVMDIERLEFPDRSFDAATCGHGLQFAPDLARALREAHRVLKPGARFGASVPAGGSHDQAWAMVDEVVSRWLPAAPQPADQTATRSIVLDPPAFRRAALDAGFSSAEVNLVEDRVRWASPEQFVSLCTGWWNCAIRLEGIDADQRQAFENEVIATLRAHHPGGFETTAGNHILFAVA